MTRLVGEMRTIAVVIMLVTSVWVGFVTVSGSAAADNQTSPDVTSSSGETIYIADDGDWTTIDASVSVGGDWDFSKAKVIIENATEDDELRLDGTVNGISQDSTSTVTHDDDGNDRFVLTLTASSATSEADWQGALRQVEYRNTNGPDNIAEKGQDREIRISLGDKLPLGSTANHNGNTYSTGHYYGLIKGDTSWSTAESNANSQNYLGKSGYLVTIRSAEEDDFVFNNLGLKDGSDYWIGATDDDTEDFWLWDASGAPDGNIQFWDGTSDSVENGEYNNWDSGEPNNDGDEDYAQYYGNSQNARAWNDVENNPGNTFQGYIVEWGDSVDGAQFNDVKTIDIRERPSFSSDESLANIDEDVGTSSNSGSQIDSSELFTENNEFSDGDGDSFAGIVVTNDASTTNEGTWQYKPSGGSWTDLGLVSDTDGLLLGTSTKLRFDPAKDFNGDPGDLTVYAVDDNPGFAFTTASTRKTYDRSNNNNASVAANSNTVGVTVNAVNDAPSFTNNESLPTIDEGVSSENNTGAKIDTNELFKDEFSDVDGQYTGTANSFDGIAITDSAATNNEGTWQYSLDGGSSWSDVGSVSDSSGLLIAKDDYLRFQPEVNFEGKPGKLTVYTVEDHGSTTYTDSSTRRTYDTTSDDETAKVAQNASVVTISVNSQNDPPSAIASSNVSSITVGAAVALDGSESFDIDDSGLTYEWDVDGDGNYELTGEKPVHRYNKVGSFTVTLRVDDGINTSTDTLTIDVSANTPPTADIGDTGADEGAIAFAAPPGRTADEIRFATADTISAELNPRAKALGPAIHDFDEDGRVELPYVAHAGKHAGDLRLIDSTGDATTLVEQGKNSDGTDVIQSKTLLAVGTWNGSDPSVFYVDKPKQTIFRVTPDADPVNVSRPDGGAEAVLGVADIDGDDDRELVYLDSSETIRYLEPTNAVASTGVTVGADNGQGVGRPVDFDADGTARVPYVTDDDNVALTSSSSQEVLTHGDQAASAPVAPADIDGDGDYEIVFVGHPPDRHLSYVDRVVDYPGVSSLDHAADDGPGIVPSATSAAPDITVDNGTAVSFNGANSTPIGAIASYEWDLDANGDFDTTGQSVSHTFPASGTYTVRLRVTDDEDLTDIDTITVQVDPSEAQRAAGLASMPTYHGDLANTGHYPDETGPTTEPTILWEESINAPIAIQPIVADETVYVGVHNPGPFYAFDKTTGKEQWQFSTEQRHAGFTWAAPAVVNGTVYVGSNDDHLYALNQSTGEVQWSYETRADVRTAPAVADGVVYFGSNYGRMQAVDAETGEEIWTYELDRPYLLESNPAVVNGVVYFGGGDDKVHAVNASSGDERWTFETPGDVDSDPTVVNDTVYVGSAQSDDSYREGMVYALDASTGKKEWSYTMDGHVDGGLVYANDVIYAGSRGGDFVALDAPTGLEIWDASGESFYGAPIVADGVVYALDFRGGTVNAFDAATGEELWQFDSPDRFLYGTPLVDGGVLYYGAYGGFYALGKPTVSLSNVNATNPAKQTVEITFDSNIEPESIEATISGAESATLTGSDFTKTRTDDGSFSYNATYTGDSYGVYDVSVTVTGDDVTDTGTDSVTIEEPPGLEATGGTAEYVSGDGPIVVAPRLEVTGGDETTIRGAKVSIGDGFAPTEDTLGYDESLADSEGISGEYDPTKGVLSFSGTGSPADYQALLRSVTYDNSEEDPKTADRAISFSIGKDSLYSPATEHYYEYVAADGITWPDARDAAANQTYFGMQGYLVTVTEAAENAFVEAKLDGASWLGASDSDEEAVWRWVTGPEGLDADGTGEHFFTQQGDGGTPIDDSYDNWANREPNDWGSGEDYGHFYGDGRWNDFAFDNGRIEGYVIEYGGMPGDPDVSLSDTRTVTVTDIDETAPTADAGSDKQVMEDTAAVFDATSSTDNVGITDYQWAFGDGTTASGATQTHVYADSGTYTAILTVTDDAGNEATDEITVTVQENSTLEADAGLGTRTVPEGTTVAVDASSSQSNEGIETYEWDFDGDGRTDATGVTAEATYGTVGTYDGTLTLTDAEGNTATDHFTVVVTDATPPVADAGAPRRTVDEDQSITFDGSGTTDESAIESYEWDFDGDGAPDRRGATVHYTFGDPGTYEVTLTAVDEYGNEDTDTQTVEVRDVTAPIAEAGEDITVNQSEVVTGDATASTDNVEIVRYEWDLDGDGQTDMTGPTISGSYDIPGTYPVTLTVTDAAGNNATDVVNATVRDSEPPTADAGGAITADEDAAVTFDGSDSSDNAGIASYEWAFGDDSFAPRATTTHTYTQSGEYTATLTVTDFGGNTATDTIGVTVVETSVLIADSGVGNRTVGAGQSTSFDASGSESNEGIDSYDWDFDGDGQPDATGATPTHTFTQPGTHEVTLTVTDNEGNSATDTATVTVTDVTPPTAATGTDSRTVAEDEAVTFDGTASADNEGIASYEWDFDGDGQPDATGPEPTHTFTTPGTYQVTLTVTDAEGNTATTTIQVTVTDETEPLANAGEDRSVPQNDPVTLDASGSEDNVGIETYAWDLDGDGAVDVTAETATTTFEELGEHEVTLTVIDAAGHENTDTVTVTVTDGTAPVADAGGSLEVAEDTAVTFDGSESTDNVGITSYEWAFGDGTTDSGQLVDHVFEDAGRFTVTLTVSDRAGHTATDTVAVSVEENSTLLADAGPTKLTTTQGESLAFDATSSQSNEGIASYEWDFDGDGTVDATGATPEHVFQQAGTHTVVLTVTDDEGNVATDTITVVVEDTSAPVASAGVSQSPVGEDTAVALYGTASTDNMGIETYEWDLDGDGTVDATGRTLTHTFSEPGSYQVTLITTDAAGNTATDIVPVAVTDTTAPVADIDGRSETDEDQAVTFSAGDSHDNVGITSYEWDLDGDGDADATGAEVTHTFTDAGNYTVSLTVTDDAGHESTDSVTVTVEETSVLVADAGPDRTVGPGTELTFDGSRSESNEGIVGYEWDFDDGTVDTRPVTRHTYLDRGTYQVELTVTDAEGNTATDTATVEVTDVTSPTADAGNDLTVQAGNRIRINGADSHDDRAVASYTWSMGDGNVITTGSPVIEYWYTSPGTYPVTLTITDEAGNTDTDVVVVEVVDTLADDGGNQTTVVNVATNQTQTTTDDTETNPDGPVTEGLRIRVQDTETGDSTVGPVLPIDTQRIRVDNAPDGSRLSLGMDTGGNGTGVEGLGNIIMDRLDVEVEDGGDFDMTVETREIDLQAVTAAADGTNQTQSDTSTVTGPNGTEPGLNVSGVDRRTVDMTIRALSDDGEQFARETGARPAGYIQINHIITNEEVGDVIHHFRVRKSYLNATGVGPQAVQLYRDESAGWNDLETQFVGETDEFFLYTADSPGLSLFTIGAHTPVFEIQDAHLVGDRVVTGKEFTVNVTVANVGNANGTYQTRLVADGAVVDTQPIAVPKNESRTVQLHHTFEEAGDHSIAIGNLELESVSVQTSTPEQTGPTVGGLDLLWLVVVILAGLLLLFILWRRQDDEEEEEEEDEEAEDEEITSAQEPGQDENRSE